jgi:hypothetical protein
MTRRSTVTEPADDPLHALDNQLESFVGCDASGHSAPVDVKAPADRLGRDLAVPDIETHGRCINRGEQQAWVRVNGYKPPVTS